MLRAAISPNGVCTCVAVRSMQDSKRAAREEVQKQLDSDIKRIILDNKRMVRGRLCPLMSSHVLSCRPVSRTVGLTVVVIVNHHCSPKS